MNTLERRIDDVAKAMRQEEYEKNIIEMGSTATGLVDGVDVMSRETPKITVNLVASCEGFSEAIANLSRAFVGGK